MRRLSRAAAVVAIVASAGIASGDESGPCLGPDAGHVLEELARAHALESDVPSGFALQRLDVEKDRVILGYLDTTGAEVAVILRASGGTRAGQPKLEYQISDERKRASAEDRVVLLRAAAQVDRALVAHGAVRYCAGPEDPRTGSAAARAPKFVGIGLGAAQVAVVAAALLFGLWREKRTEK